ncbi:MAG: GAF domain-containing protein [Anaerolineaceae bacterium]|nr:MAG: GAF domain-containing protein [Anaerolineaceae bacterium]
MRFLRTNLTARLIFLFTTLSAIIIAIIALISFVNARNALTQSVYERLDAVSTLKEEELNRWIFDKQNEIVFLSRRSELNRNLRTLAAHDEDTSFYQAAHNSLTIFLTTESSNLTSFQELILLSPVGGKILVSTEQENEGQYRVSDSYYSQGRLGLYIQKVYTSPQTGKPTLTISAPVYDTQGNLVGVLAAHLDLERLDSVILQRAGLGETGETYLVDRFNNFISAARFGERELPRGIHTEGIDAAMEGIDGKGEYPNYDGIPVIGVYRSLEEWDVVILTEISQAEAFAPARRLGIAVTLAGLVTALALAFIAYFLANQIARPVLAIRDTALQIASGNLEVKAPVTTQDEIGILAESFNRMTSQLQETLGSLEQRVAERTADLEISRRQSDKRASQLLAVGEISKVINSEQKFESLLALITRLVSDHFGFYHTGIFLLDETEQFAILHAANSEGGRNMLKRGHKLKIGESGIVGYVAKYGEPRIALDVGLDAVFFDNPDLPATRSEMALPLKLRDEIVGVLDVQSEKPGAFSDEDANILSILADQIAIAIENAKLFTQTQQALSEAQALYRQNLKEGWSAFVGGAGMVGYYKTPTGGNKLTQPINTEEIQQVMNRGEVIILHADGRSQEPALVIPIKLRGQIIGVMQIKAPSLNRQWTANEIGLTETVAERLSLALENARLIEESQQQAIKEQTISDITGKIGSSINFENVLLTAVEELGRSIPGSEVVIKFENEESDEGME